jgi:hypothetical protein
MNRNRRTVDRVDDRIEGRASEQLAGGLERVSALLTRRGMLGGALKLAGGAMLAPLLGPIAGAPRRAAGDDAVKTGQFIFPRLQFSVYDKTPDIWNVHPIGDANLRKKLAELTNINVSTQPAVVRLDDFDDMVLHPFVFMTSEGYFRISEQEQKNLREFLERGGFVHADDCVFNAKEDRFARCYRDLINKLFPDNPMRSIPLDHEIFHIYYDFPKGFPHCQGVRWPGSNGYGLFEPGTGRIMTLITPGDLHCGWVWRIFDEKTSLDAIKMGINIIIYFLSH